MIPAPVKDDYFCIVVRTVETECMAGLKLRMISSIF